MKSVAVWNRGYTILAFTPLEIGPNCQYRGELWATYILLTISLLGAARENATRASHLGCACMNTDSFVHHFGGELNSSRKGPEAMRPTGDLGPRLFE